MVVVLFGRCDDGYGGRGGEGQGHTLFTFVSANLDLLTYLWRVTFLRGGKLRDGWHTLIIIRRSSVVTETTTELSALQYENLH